VAAARPSLAVRDGVAQGVYALDRGHGFPEPAAGERVDLPSGFNPAEGAAFFRPCSLFHVSPHWLPLLTQRAVDEKCKTCPIDLYCYRHRHRILSPVMRTAEFYPGKGSETDLLPSLSLAASMEALKPALVGSELREVEQLSTRVSRITKPSPFLRIPLSNCVRIEK
jgi:hypothetical protein